MSPDEEHTHTYTHTRTLLLSSFVPCSFLFFSVFFPLFAFAFSFFFPSPFFLLSFLFCFVLFTLGFPLFPPVCFRRLVAFLWQVLPHTWTSLPDSGARVLTPDAQGVPSFVSLLLFGSLLLYGHRRCHIRVVHRLQWKNKQRGGGVSPFPAMKAQPSKQQACALRTRAWRSRGGEVWWGRGRCAGYGFHLPKKKGKQKKTQHSNSKSRALFCIFKGSGTGVGGTVKATV